jgi:hypothetical protein
MQSTSFSKECFKKMVIEALREVSDASCLRYDTDEFSVVSRDGKVRKDLWHDYLDCCDTSPANRQDMIRGVAWGLLLDVVIQLSEAYEDARADNTGDKYHQLTDRAIWFSRRLPEPAPGGQLRGVCWMTLHGDTFPVIIVHAIDHEYLDKDPPQGVPFEELSELGRLRKALPSLGLAELAHSGWSLYSGEDGDYCYDYAYALVVRMTELETSGGIEAVASKVANLIQRIKPNHDDENWD